MCDADVDGSHIQTLIMTFFFRYMKELIENGYLYIATSIIFNQKGKQASYAWNDDQRDQLINQMKGSGSESWLWYTKMKDLEK